jgi:hypothetical protein
MSEMRKFMKNTHFRAFVIQTKKTIANGSF